MAEGSGIVEHGPALNLGAAVAALRDRGRELLLPSLGGPWVVDLGENEDRDVIVVPDARIPLWLGAERWQG